MFTTRRGVTLVEVLVTVAIVAVLTALLVPAVMNAREAARRANCLGRFGQLSLSIDNYHSATDRLPPAYLANAQGHPQHSWRVLILGFMEQSGLYNSYNFSESWNARSNTTVGALRPISFVCPSDGGSKGNRRSNQFVITGPGTAFPGPVSLKIGDIGDGTETTLMVVESSNAHTDWTEPRDLDIRTMGGKINDRRAPSISSWHYRGANVGFFDSHPRYLSNSVPPATLRALLTANGGEAVTLKDLGLNPNGEEPAHPKKAP